MPPFDPLIVLLGVGSLGVGLYQLFVTVRLVRFGGYSVRLKIAQAVLIWLLPLFGAWIVHVVIRGTEESVPGADRNFTPQNQQNVW